jgi:predicted phosphodiesterase
VAAVALLYDVHGNLPALEAVLADAAGAGAERYALGGDYALFGAWPAETLARLEQLPQATWIRGNGERWTAAPDDAPADDVVRGAIAACARDLGRDAVARLASLPEQHVDGATRYCHGSPVSDVRSFLPAAADSDEDLLGEATEPRLVFGHTHLPFARRGPRGTELVNPGSVGMPFDADPRAAYALIASDGSVEHRRVAYDRAPVIEQLRGRGEQWAEVVAGRIERAQL